MRGDGGQRFEALSGKRVGTRLGIVLAVLALAAGCAGRSEVDPPVVATSTTAPSGTEEAASALESPNARGAEPAPLALPTAPELTFSDEVVVVPYRIEVRTTDAATATFAADAAAILADRRGWSRAGFRFELRADAPHVLVLAEGPEVDELCLPYETFATYSCQNGATVALNADRWRSATDQFPGALADYRTYLVNHEMGHLLGVGHLRCTRAGSVAPVMEQQSSELDENGCLPNGWPTDFDVEVARRRSVGLAPGPDVAIPDVVAPPQTPPAPQTPPTAPDNP